MKKLNSFMLKIFRLSVILFCAIFIGKYFYNNMPELKKIISINLGHIMGLIALSAGYYIIESIKMFIIFKKIGLSDVRLGKWFNIYFAGKFLNLYILQGGNLLQALVLKSRYNFNHTLFISSLAFEMWFRIFIFTFLSSIALLLFDPFANIQKINIASFFFLVACLIFSAPFIIKKFFMDYLLNKKDKIKILRHLYVMSKSVSGCVSDRALLKTVAFFAVINFIICICWMRLCFHSLNFFLSLPQVLTFTVSIQMSKYVQIVPGNLGLTEVLGGYLSKSLGGSLGEGILVMSIERIIGSFIIILFGLIFGWKLLFNNDPFLSDHQKSKNNFSNK